ncbi:ABC-F family ATP-binding cassette domain-containing protein [Mucilaginibacter arboris]|uniref:ATP-binding cassette domain-containing protein n=1 Tax=Mucilaginibacter arboris TaxID=2682090 RepID=A0A7K1SZN7_9SPHI|nr:ABC-F family ATP-binding cassette domain-containing protein [Mucilaginibacter arboris]MVN22779.1 ATP-binding cassette domain-containing protein [Mucilaginibacter arboris]
MSTLISAENLGHSFHDNWLFKQQTFGINSGRRIALVGANGAGKSTLLKILAEKLKPTEGKVVKSKFLSMGYLEQDPSFNPEETINDFIFKADNEQQQLIKAYELLLENDPENYEQIEILTNKITELEAWEYEYKIKNILDRLDVRHLDQQIKTLSGGQKKRLALAELLISDPELFVLDEPTNHLDIETIEWLESFLTSGNKTILLVTHDRYFLDNVCNEILEIDQQKIFPYNGNYSYYLEKRAEREAADQVRYQKNSNLLKKELEWMRRMPQARSTKSKSRIDAFYDLQSKTQNNGHKEQLDLTIKSARQGNKVLEIKHLSKSFNNITIIKDFNYVFKKGDRIGLAGKNGSGKSTLLNILTGQTPPDSGAIDVGETTTIGYYRQSGLNFNEAERVIDVIKNVAEFITMADGKLLSASQLLTQFLFPPKKQHGFISNLSGGEKKRLQLLTILIKNPNFLILDEPTNDLDTDTLNVLEEFLTNFGGVIMLVSHDRYLIDKLTEQLFIFTGEGHLQIYNGNYTDYRLEETVVKQKTKTQDKPLKASVPEIKKPSNYKQEKELLEVEMDIASVESKIAELNLILNNPSSKTEDIILASKNVQTYQIELDAFLNKWMNLSELKES